LAAPRSPAPVEPLRWEDGTLVVLDQRALPREERWIRCKSAEQVAECIRTLAVRGAPAVGIAAAYALALAAARGDDLDSAGSMLRATRPTAVNLGWAIDRTLEGAGGDSAAHLETARRIHAEQHDADLRMARLGADRFEPGDRALTHCNAGALATAGYGTAGGVLRAAWEAGRLAEVWVDETRPLLQGARLTAWELGRAGIPHRVVADSAAASLLSAGEVDRVVVGADRIAANGDVANKIGTYPLAVVAARHGVPFYVAAPVSTIDLATPDGAHIPIEERAEREVTHIGTSRLTPEGARIRNLAFDVTPYRYITGIITEKGIFEPPYSESLKRAIEAAA
jgi:methylthioribose-1-phosphate isomerase